MEYQLHERKSDDMLIAFEKLKCKFNLATIRIPYENLALFNELCYYNIIKKNITLILILC